MLSSGPHTHTYIATYKLNRPQGQFSEKTSIETKVPSANSGNVEKGETKTLVSCFQRLSPYLYTHR